MNNKTQLTIRVNVLRKPFAIYLGLWDVTRLLPEEQVMVLNVSGESGRSYVTLELDLDGELFVENGLLVDVISLRARLHGIDVTAFLTEGSRQDAISELWKRGGYDEN